LVNMTIRERVLEALDAPRCAREIAERSGLPVKTVQSVLARMADEGLARCVTPQVRQARLYALTAAGRRLRREVLGEWPQDAGDARPLDELVVYAWIQAGRYRRLVLQHLHETMTARSLRQTILPAHPRLSMTHVYDVLRAFRRRGVVEREGDGWRLSVLGERLQRVACTSCQSNGQLSR
jgi:DNA-binding IclR family transcriptional regulator